MTEIALDYCTLFWTILGWYCLLRSKILTRILNEYWTNIFTKCSLLNAPSLIHTLSHFFEKDSALLLTSIYYILHCRLSGPKPRGTKYLIRLVISQNCIFWACGKLFSSSFCFKKVCPNTRIIFNEPQILTVSIHIEKKQYKHNVPVAIILANILCDASLIWIG